ncbi:hypothetical protein BCR34DRAFT_28335 [Clohesyomyces aquaticus]|uniref:F-box domain-containing protein n=1 Tax=Clohesyomyces aquaticus TaxID=1231657 RepID=A0A1Y1ZA48_9PLEO|nr:hypothetical protein BCR34DRAFT_28335 [Clohesyomyces aquaticus]
MMQRLDFSKREDVQVWKERLSGKRVTTSDPQIAAHDLWKDPKDLEWVPRIFFAKPIGEGFDQHITFDAQPRSILLSLPPELRNRILEFALTMDVPQADQLDNFKGEVRWENLSAVIFTCKQLYAEGRAMAVRRHTIDSKIFPKKTRFCGEGRPEDNYVWNM